MLLESLLFIAALAITLVAMSPRQRVTRRPRHLLVGHARTNDVRRRPRRTPVSAVVGRVPAIRYLASRAA
jgi:hypothetical protein